MSGFFKQTKQGASTGSTLTPNVGQYGWTLYESQSVSQIIGFVNEAKGYAVEAATSANNARESAELALTYVNLAKDWAGKSEVSYNASKEEADRAERYANQSVDIYNTFLNVAANQRIIETFDLAVDQTEVTFTKIMADAAFISVNGQRIDSCYLVKDIDYTITGISKITLKRRYPFGTKLSAVQDIKKDESVPGVSESAAIWNRQFINALVGVVFGTYVVDGRTLTPRLVFEGSQYIPTYDATESVQFTAVPIKQNNGDLVIPTNKGNRTFSRTEAEAVNRQDLEKATSPVVNILKFDVKGDGTDESEKVQKALDYLRDIGGGDLYFPTMTIRCDNPLIGYTNTSLRGAPNSWLDFSHRTDYLTTQDLGLLVFRGTASEEIGLINDAVYGTNKIKVPNASAFKVGDLVEISMNDKGSYDDPSIGVKSGQLNIVSGSYADTNNIVLDTIIFDTLTVAKGARIRKVTPVENVIIDGLGFKGKGRPSAAHGGPGDQGVKIFFGKDVTVKNCRFDRIDARSMDMVNCFNYLVDNNSFIFDPLGDLDQISYAIAYCGSYHGTISNNRIVNPRHGVVSSHLSSANANKYYGVSRFLLISGNSITGNYGDLGTSGFVRAHAGISTHTDAEYLTISQNFISACRYGINPRTWNIQMSENTIVGCKVGLYLSEAFANVDFTDNIVNNCSQAVATTSVLGSLARNGLKITNNKFTDCGTLQVRCDTPSTGLEIHGNTITSSTYTGASGVVSVFGPFSGSVDGNVLFDIKAPGIRLETARGVIVKDNTISHQTGNTAAIYAKEDCDKIAIIDNVMINAGNISGTPGKVLVSGNVQLKGV